ncbi:MAG TPA: stage II sporulation protein M, partial [Phototrophicaceae bacterium]|nr:stage II sporulation protein M [Phototrophicaceae bacterium]
VGEKERRSLEPLLSTPLSNTELYIGKMLAAMIPPLVSSYGGMMVYLSGLVFGDLAWRPQPMLVAQIIMLTTVQALVMVTGAVVVSSQTTSTRAANLLDSFIIIPMSFLIQGESAIMFLAPDAEAPAGIGALWAIIVGMIVVVVLMLRVGNSIFNREELLGRTIDQLNLKNTAKRLWKNFLAVDPAGTRARSVGEWYRRGVRVSLGRMRPELIITVGVFLLAVAAGVVIAQMPEWKLPLTADSTVNLDAQSLGQYLSISTQTGGFRAIVWQNGRILLGAAALAMFTFGVAALILTPAVYVILGYLFAQILAAGVNPGFMIAGVFTHGIVEIPVIVVATAAAFHLGAVVTKPPHGLTVGQAWMRALGDTLRIAVGLVIPGLIIAAAIEAYITPRVVLALLGGG